MKKNQDTSGTHLWLILMKAQKTLLRHAVKSIEALDICTSDFAILEALLHKGPLLVSELGRRIDLTSGSITTAVDRLEARRLVSRVSDPGDRRARVVHLTAAGKAAISPIFTAHKSAMDEVGKGLSENERATLIGLLKKLGVSADEKLKASKEKI
jgi:MarR family 2-MHQ and catechol resistance regulon transcriptional repressor